MNSHIFCIHGLSSDMLFKSSVCLYRLSTRTNNIASYVTSIQTLSTRSLYLEFIESARKKPQIFLFISNQIREGVIYFNANINALVMYILIDWFISYIRTIQYNLIHFIFSFTSPFFKFLNEIKIYIYE